MNIMQTFTLYESERTCDMAKQQTMVLVLIRTKIHIALLKLRFQKFFFLKDTS